MNRLDADFARRCAGLWRAAGAQRQLFAPPAVPRRAAGTEPSGFGDYACGDDYRYVDWNRVARLDELVTRQFYGSERRRVLLLLDVSASMSIGQPAKFDAARELAAALGYASLARYDEVDVAGFSESVSEFPGPLNGVAGAVRLFRLLQSLPTQSGATNLLAAARWIAGRPGEPGLVVVVSDLFDPDGFERPLDLLRRRGCGVHVVQLYAPEDARPQLAGRVRFEDVETQRLFSATIDEQDIANYCGVFQEFCASVRSFCVGRGMACTQLCSDAPLVAAFAAVVRSARKLGAMRAGA